MVLRGSGIKPSTSLTDLQDAIAALEYQIEQTQKEIRRNVEDLRRLGKVAASKEGGFSTIEIEFEKILINLDSLDSRLATSFDQKREAQEQYLFNLQTLLAGGVATSCARTAVAPIDRIKIFLQTNTDIKGPVNVFRHVIQKEGLKGLWRGNLVNCSRVFFKGGLQFVIYDDFKKRLKHIIGNKTWGSKLACALVGSLFVTSFLHPIDLMRLRVMRENSLTIGGFLKQTFVQEGVRGFYRGYLSSLMGTAPFFSIQFATTDYLKERFDVKPGSIKILGLGAAGSVFASMICFPTDTIQKKVMSSGKAEGVTIPSIIRGVSQHPFNSPKGVAGLYRGFSMNCLKVGPQTGLRFWFCDLILAKGLRRGKD